MIERFSGAEGKRILVDALLVQPLVLGDATVAAALAEVVEVEACEAGAVLIEQHGEDNDLILVLAGAFAIIVNGREVARRVAPQHLGEMAIIDPKARRSASAIALEDAVVARISEAAFARIADKHPSLWRRIACELGERLRQRNELVRVRNELPRVFIGSSSEALDVANGIQSGLARDPFIVTVWTNGVFGPSDFPVEALERTASESDFAILVLSPDDVVHSRGDDVHAPRDNVVFELGLFIGAVGRHRVFLVAPSGVDIKLPTDLLGVTTIPFASSDPKGLASLLGPVCTQLRASINNLGPV